MDEQHIDVTLAALSTKALHGGALTAFLGWFVSSGMAAFIGVCIAVLGFVMNAYFRNRADKREQAEHEARMRKLMRDSRPAPLASEES